ncbi:MAG: peptidase S10, partial [Sphingomicrobium sp.]
MNRFHLLAATAALVIPQPGAAQDKPATPTPAPAAKEAPAAPYIPQVRTTRHSGIFGGQRMTYQATIGETVLKNKDGVDEAAIVTTSYVRQPRDPKRPVTFLFNGG